MNEENHADLVSLATDIVSAYIANSHVDRADLPSLIAEVHHSLSRIASGKTVDEPIPEKLIPAVSVRKSVQPDFLICLEDGKRYKSLKRHLRTKYGLSPDEYRAKWGLLADYPMVAPNYAEARSRLAKTMGLGQRLKAQPEPEAAPETVVKRKRAYRKKEAA
jgi:predicted transcriptional regulator